MDSAAALCEHARNSQTGAAMHKKPLLIASIVAAVSAIGFSTTASADVGAGIIIGGTVGALVGGPPGAVAGAMVGAAIGEPQEYKDARIYGERRVVALPPPGFYGTPPDYYQQPRRYAPPPVAYYPPAPRPYYAPQTRVVYVSPPYYYRSNYREHPAF